MEGRAACVAGAFNPAAVNIPGRKKKEAVNILTKLLIEAADIFFP